MSSIIREAAFWAAIASCAIAQFLIVRSTLRSTPARGTASPTQRNSRPAELAWVILPGIALAIVFALTWQQLRASPSRINHDVAPTGQVMS